MTDLAYRTFVGLVGGLVLCAGIVMIPYPGPGWLVVFAGLAILGTEFSWAKRLLRYARRKYDGWDAWVRRQRMVVRVAVLLGTALVVLATLWLLNVFGLITGWVRLDWPWVESPLGVFG